MKRVAIVQSNYLPWKGYFDLIASVDEFILFDDAKYTRRDWRNRNRIKTHSGVQWLTVPVAVKGKYDQLIRETEISNPDWAQTHWRTLEQNYRRAPFFDEVASWLEPVYLRPWRKLSLLNRELLQLVCDYLDISTHLSFSSDYKLVAGRSARLASLVKQVGGEVYISGPSAKAYLDDAPFEEQGIKVCWFGYDGYEAYPQLWGDFIHEVSIVDVLFNCGPQAPRFALKTAKSRP